MQCEKRGRRESVIEQGRLSCNQAHHVTSGQRVTLPAVTRAVPHHVTLRHPVWCVTASCCRRRSLRGLSVPPRQRPISTRTVRDLRRSSTESRLSLVVGCLSSVFVRLPSVVRRQSSAVSRQPSVVTRQSSLSRQSSVVSQSSSVSRQSSVVSHRIPTDPAQVAARWPDHTTHRAKCR